MDARSQLSWGVRPGELRTGFLSIHAASPPSRRPCEGRRVCAPARFAGVGAPDGRDRESAVRFRATECAGVDAPRPACRATVRRGKAPGAAGRLPNPGPNPHCNRRARGSILVERAVAIATTARVSPRRACSPAVECWALDGHRVSMTSFPRWSQLSRMGRFHALLWRVSKAHYIEGFEVRLLLPDRSERNTMLEKLRDALGLIAERDPLRFAYLRRDVPRIFAGISINHAEYWAELSMCLFRFDCVKDPAVTPQQLALTLLHEGAHARLARAGFTYEEARRTRIERICVATECHFARKLPDSEVLRAAAEARLERPPEFWTDEAFQSRAASAVANGDVWTSAGTLIARPIAWMLRHRRRLTYAAADERLRG